MSSTSRSRGRGSSTYRGPGNPGADPDRQGGPRLRRRAPPRAGDPRADGSTSSISPIDGGGQASSSRSSAPTERSPTRGTGTFSLSDAGAIITSDGYTVQPGDHGPGRGLPDLDLLDRRRQRRDSGELDPDRDREDRARPIPESMGLQAIGENEYMSRPPPPESRSPASPQDEDSDSSPRARSNRATSRSSRR